MMMVVTPLMECFQVFRTTRSLDLWQLDDLKSEGKTVPLTRRTCVWVRRTSFAHSQAHCQNLFCRVGELYETPIMTTYHRRPQEDVLVAAIAQTPSVGTQVFEDLDVDTQPQAQPL